MDANGDDDAVVVVVVDDDAELLDCQHLTKHCSNIDRLRAPAIRRQIVDAVCADGVAAAADDAVAVMSVDAALPVRMPDAAASEKRTSCRYSCNCCTTSMMRPAPLPMM